MASPRAVAASITSAVPQALPRPLPLVLAAAVVRWPVESQQRARRNALLATTALTQRRRERDDVEEFLDAHSRRWERAEAIVASRQRRYGVHADLDAIAQPGTPTEADVPVRAAL